MSIACASYPTQITMMSLKNEDSSSHPTSNSPSYSKPSVPEFTLKYVDNSYKVPPEYSIDPFTGKTVRTKAGYTFKNEFIEVWIKNPATTSLDDETSSSHDLYYNVRFKGHFEDWSSSSDPLDYVHCSND